MHAGIDFDTHAIHVVLLPEEGPARYFPFVMHGWDAFERTRVVRDVMPARGWWKDEGVIACGIEEPMRRRGGGQQLMVVQGAILACLPRDLLVQPMMPSTWRKHAGLPGNATKEDVATFVNRGQPWPPERQDWPQDACDAYCLALAVQKLTVTTPLPAETAARAAATMTELVENAPDYSRLEP